MTYSIVIGTPRCNANCPYCVSKMTGFKEMISREKVNWINFRKACRFAQMGETTTVLFTGKGEPTLFPAEIEAYLNNLQKYDFPFIELQTNGLALGYLARDNNSHVDGLDKRKLYEFYQLGLNTIAISVVHYENNENKKIYNHDYPDLATTISFLHQIGFTVRLCVTMLKNYIDDCNKLAELIEWCVKHQVDQLTVRPVRKPDNTNNQKVLKYVEKYQLTIEQEKAVADYLKKVGVRLMQLPHGALIYDVNGQNVSLADCLTLTPHNDDIRTLIFYANGMLRYDWQYQGAVLLGGKENDK